MSSDHQDKLVKADSAAFVESDAVADLDYDDDHDHSGHDDDEDGDEIQAPADDDETQEDAEDAKPNQQPITLAEEIIDSILNPGIKGRVAAMMNLSFAFLILSLIVLAVLTGGNIHVLILIVISACLFASLQWFLYELSKGPPLLTNEELKKQNDEYQASLSKKTN
ncbi:ER protein Pkr1-domain-containing protein [Polychytrium aggregatum]|uniref:ER protein Pkr1-domain-containing protein n=1 Tax=Polychytrium aggregatum TaxID=110093 RepID=UPI0022FEDB32|nr:ER protein Pkr1-domain-containing protein [Polychytrium aggregatum]KAI9205851.1 ER protein Pkr1-domain-containing protein [Polychytrium aggregatum]